MSEKILTSMIPRYMTILDGTLYMIKRGYEEQAGVTFGRYEIEELYEWTERIRNEFREAVHENDRLKARIVELDAERRGIDIESRRWIPTSKRLPEGGNEYFVTYEGGDMDGKSYIFFKQPPNETFYGKYHLAIRDRWVDGKKAKHYVYVLAKQEGTAA